MEYKVRPGDTLCALARRFGVPRADLARWNNIDPNYANHLKVGSDIVIRAPLPTNEDPMTDEAPKPEQSQHAADHVEGVMDAMDAVFSDVKAAAAAVKSRLRAEGEDMKANMQLFEERVVGRMRVANTRFRNMIGGNGGPPLDDGKTIEHKPE